MSSPGGRKRPVRAVPRSAGLSDAIMSALLLPLLLLLKLQKGAQLTGSPDSSRSTHPAQPGRAPSFTPLANPLPTNASPLHRHVHVLAVPLPMPFILQSTPTSSDSFKLLSKASRKPSLAPPGCGGSLVHKASSPGLPPPAPWSWPSG